MSTGDLNKKNTARLCPKCGEVFTALAKFCPEDGTKLSEELPTTGGAIQISDKTSRSVLPVIPDSADNSGTNIGSNDRQSRRFRGSAGSGASGATQAENKSIRESEIPIALPGDAMIGALIDNDYKILSLVGQGGMSLVYKANHLLLKKMVAVKTLLPHLVLHPTSLERFRQEAQAASTLKHPNIVTIHHFGFTAGQPYLVMDFIEGISLSGLIKRDRRVQPERAVHIFAQIADGLAHAHAKGVVHRDLKPSNILLIEKYGDSHHVQIVDFGIAKLLPQAGQEALNLTQTGELFGSPYYMSPEQATGEHLDARSDIYSLGCLMYETVTGRPPLEGDNTLEVLYKQKHEIPAGFGTLGVKVPSKLEAIIFKCLAKQPAQRYQSMDDLHKELVALFKKDASILSRIFTRWELFLLRRPPRSSRDRALVLAETLLLIFSFAIASYLVLLDFRARESPASRQVLTWEEDVKQPSVAPTSAETLSYTLITSSANRYFEGESKDGQDVADLINKLESFGKKMAEKHCLDFACGSYERAYRIGAHYNGPEAIKTLFSQTHYADVLREKGDPKAAEMYLDLISRLQPHNVQDPQTRALLTKNIGESFYSMRDYKNAAGNFERALEFILMRNSDHENNSKPADSVSFADTALCESHLAMCEVQLSKKETNENSRMRLLSKAAYHFKDASRQWALCRGEGSYNGMITQLKLAQTYQVIRDYAGAQKAFETALAYADRISGPASATKGLILREYSGFLWQKGDLLNSISTRVKAWTILADAK